MVLPWFAVKFRKSEEIFLAVNIDYDFTFEIIILDHPLVKNIEETNPPQSNTDMSCSIPLVVFDFDHTLVGECLEEIMIIGGW